MDRLKPASPTKIILCDWAGEARHHMLPYKNKQVIEPDDLWEKALELVKYFYDRGLNVMLRHSVSGGDILLLVDTKSFSQR